MRCSLREAVRMAVGAASSRPLHIESSQWQSVHINTVKLLPVIQPLGLDLSQELMSLVNRTADDKSARLVQDERSKKSQSQFAHSLNP